jgi:hypothetical protein
MKRSESQSTVQAIYRLRRQINSEKDTTKLRGLAVELQIALSHQQSEMPPKVLTRTQEKNPFDALIL